MKEEEKEEEEEEKQTNTIFDVWYCDGTLSNIGCQNHLHNKLSLTVKTGMKPRHKCRHMKWNEVTNTLFSFQLQVAETLCTAAQQKLTSEGESRST